MLINISLLHVHVCFSITMNHFFKNSLTRFICSLNHFHFSFTQSSRKFSHFSVPESWRSMEGLIRCSANYVPLTPISFLERAAKAYRDTTSVVYGSVKYTWGDTHERCLKLASALTQLGISRGDVVSWFIWFFLFVHDSLILFWVLIIVLWSHIYFDLLHVMLPWFISFLNGQNIPVPLKRSPIQFNYIIILVLIGELRDWI